MIGRGIGLDLGVSVGLTLAKPGPLAQAPVVILSLMLSLFVETTETEGVNPPSFFTETQPSVEDFKREVKIKSFSSKHATVKSPYNFPL